MATYYWVGGTGTWSATGNTQFAITSGGAPTTLNPNATDTVIFDSLSGTGTCTTSAGATCIAATLNSSTLVLSLGANLSIGNAFTLTLGTLNLSSFTLTSAGLVSSNSNTRSVNFGTGKIVCTANGSPWQLNTATNCTFTGSKNVELTYAGALATGINNGGTAGGSEALAINFTVTAGSYVLTIGSNSAIGNLIFTGFTGDCPAFARTIYGNLTYASGMTITAGTGVTTLAATSGTQQITTNGKTLDFPITQNGVGGTVQLQDNLTMGSTRTFTLTAGALDLSSGNRTLSTGLFSSSNSFVRSIAFGTGNITVTGNAGSVINMTTMTEFSYSGTPTFNSTYAGSVGTRNFLLGNGVGATASNVIDVNITAGTDILGVATYVGNLNLTGFAGTLSNSVRYVYGNFNVPSGATLTAGTGTTVFAATSGIKLITTNNQTLDFPIFIGDVGNTSANATFRLIGNLTIGSTRNTLLASGTLDLNENTLSTGTVSSTQNNTRVIVFGSLGQITTTGTGTVWNVTATLGFSHTGTSKINVSNNSATAVLIVTTTTTEAQSLNFNFINGTYTLTSTAQFRSVDYTGFSGTLNNNVRTIYGSATFSTGMTLTAGTNTTTFASTSAGNIITSAGQTQDYPITFNGVGGVWTCQDALTLGATCALTLTNGTLNLKSNAASTVGSFVTTGTNQKFLGSSTLGTQATISDASGVNSANYLTISDSFATGGADWEAFYANNNVDAGNNSNWDFGATPILGTEYTYTLRSFTQPRRF